MNVSTESISSSAFLSGSADALVVKFPARETSILVLHLLARDEKADEMRETFWKLGGRSLQALETEDSEREATLLLLMPSILSLSLWVFLFFSLLDTSICGSFPLWVVSS